MQFDTKFTHFSFSFSRFIQCSDRKSLFLSSFFIITKEKGLNQLINIIMIVYDIFFSVQMIQLKNNKTKQNHNKLCKWPKVFKRKFITEAHTQTHTRTHSIKQSRADGAG